MKKTGWIAMLMIAMMLMAACGIKLNNNSGGLRVNNERGTAEGEVLETAVSPEDESALGTEDISSSGIENKIMTGTESETDTAGEEIPAKEEAHSPEEISISIKPRPDKDAGRLLLEKNEDGSWSVVSEDYYQTSVRLVLCIACGVFAACVLFIGSYIAYALIRRR